jgi:hypothetical protein
MKKSTKQDSDGYTTIDFECDNKTLKLLKSVAELARVTIDQVVSVILATHVVNEGGFKAAFKDKKPTTSSVTKIKNKK